MAVTSTAYHYLEWLPTVTGMDSTTDQDTVRGVDRRGAACAEKPHTSATGDRRGFGRIRWSRTIQGAYRSIKLSLPSPADRVPDDDAIDMQLQLLQDQLRTLGSYTMYTDGGWEYGGDGMDAPFYPYTDSPSHKGGGQITTNLARIKNNMTRRDDSASDTPDHVAIRSDLGEAVDHGSNPQELLALLGALAISQRLETQGLSDKHIGSDCE
jgi:hypothetical protein